MIDSKELLEFFKNRRSIRIYQDKPIPDEEIKTAALGLLQIAREVL